VRYDRCGENLGAARNFNRVFELCRGEYFKWAAHDDLCDREFLSRCVETLDADPSVVLCCSKVRIIDQRSEMIENYDRKLATDSTDAIVRFHALIHGHLCYEIFGLIRSAALRNTPVMGNYAHGDGVLLARLALQGRFREIPEYLFFSRHHPQRSVSVMKDRCMYTVWFDPSKKGRLVFPHWRMFAEYVKSVGRSPLRWSDRMTCYRLMTRWLISCRRRLLRDLHMAGRQVLGSRK
jgi:hypothetical protein